MSRNTNPLSNSGLVFHGARSFPHFVRAIFHALLRNTIREGFPSQTQCLGADDVDYILILFILLFIVYVYIVHHILYELI